MGGFGARGDGFTFNRRDLLRAGAAAGLGVAVGSASPGAAGQVQPSTFPAPFEPPPFELEELTVRELQAGMASGRWTAVALTGAYLERISAVDGSLRSVIEGNPDALEIAARLDAERRAGHVRGPLHGIPVLVKDNLATADRMETTAGSLALVGARPSRDAFAVRRLREAGAVLLGKTNLSEWANFRSTRSSSGWSARGGQCRNPYCLDRSPCGSSSGSGAAVAANLAAVAVGTETDGSVVCPSHACGLVGVKPTLGLVSRSGIVPIAHSQDTAGPMARTVADAAALLEVLAGVDPDDAATAAAGRPGALDLTAALDPDGLRGARIGVARKDFFGYHPGADRLAEQALQVMKDLGATVVDPADIPHVGDYDDAELDVLLYEFKAGLARYLREWAPSAEVRNLADVVQFNRANRLREMPYFGQELFLQAVERGPLTDRSYRKALSRCRTLSREKGLDAVLEGLRLDAIVAPTGGPAWPVDLVNGDHFLGASSTPAAVSGYPSITVPAGQVHGLPVGITFIGRAWSESTLIRLAYAFEQATLHRQSPRFVPTLEVR